MGDDRVGTAACGRLMPDLWEPIAQLHHMASAGHHKLSTDGRTVPATNLTDSPLCLLEVEGGSNSL